jgi:WD40 repeat protein
MLIMLQNLFKLKLLHFSFLAVLFYEDAIKPFHDLKMATSNLDITWAFGYSKDVIGSVHSLCSKERNALFLLSSHSGVIYDFEHRKQTVLQGHCNIITCCAVDKSKRWIVTADSGTDPIMIVWDSINFLPVKTFQMPHQFGIRTLDISEDGLYIVTLSDFSSENFMHHMYNQEIAIWAWTTEEENAIQRTVIQSSPSGKIFKHVKFNPSNSFQICTTSSDAVQFWDWSNFALESYFGKISKLDLGNFSGDFASTIFLPNSETSLTATSHGYVVVWENRNLSVKSKVSVVKTAVKVVKLLECGINLMDTTFNGYLVIGCQDGAVRFYDYYLRLEAWFEELNAGPITSLSFSLQDSPYPTDEAGRPGIKFWTPDFVVSTKNAFVIGVESRLFEEIRKEDRRGTLLMQGLADMVVSLACHPKLPLIAFLCKSSVLQLWNYEMKLLMNIREFAFLLNNNAAPTPNEPSNDGTTRLATATKIITAKDVAFHPNGKLLAVSFSSGMVKLLTTDTLQDLQNFNNSSDAIHRIKFSISGKYFAAYDDKCHVLLYQRSGCIFSIFLTESSLIEMMNACLLLPQIRWKVERMSLLDALFHIQRRLLGLSSASVKILLKL